MANRKAGFIRLGILWIGILAVSISLASLQEAATDSPTKIFPPLTDKEKMILREAGSDRKEIESFFATRKYMRQLGVFVAELPVDVKYDPTAHGAPRPPENINIDYALDSNEQLLLYKIILMCSGNENDNISKCGRSHPFVKPADTGAPVDTGALLAQLIPPATPEEIKLLEKANRFPVSEIPKFIETRKYMRRIKKMIAELPPGQKFDPSSAPEPSRLIDCAYTLVGECALVDEIRWTWMEKQMSKREKKKE